MNPSPLGAQSPLYEIKADLFKALAHPMRIRILEVICADPNQPVQVKELLAATGLEASHLSQHLAVLRRNGVLTAQRRSSAVFYTLAHPSISELLSIAREFLLASLRANQDRLEAAQALPKL